MLEGAGMLVIRRCHPQKELHQSLTSSAVPAVAALVLALTVLQALPAGWGKQGRCLPLTRATRKGIMHSKHLGVGGRVEAASAGAGGATWGENRAMELLGSGELLGARLIDGATRKVAADKQGKLGGSLSWKHSW